MDNRPHTPRLDFSGVVPSGILQTILVDIVFPYMLYQLLASHISLLIAFALAAIIPLANIIRIRLTFHIFDLIGIVALYVIIWAFINTMVQSNLSIVSVLLTYTFPIGLLGLVILCTRLLAKPLLFYVDRYFRSWSSEQPTRYDDYWKTQETYRQAIYRLNLVWGSGQVLLAVVFMLLFLWLPATFFSLCSLVVLCLFYILLTMWSVHYMDEHTKNWNEANINDPHTSSSLPSRQDF